MDLEEGFHSLVLREEIDNAGLPALGRGQVEEEEEEDLEDEDEEEARIDKLEHQLGYNGGYAKQIVYAIVILKREVNLS